MFLQRTSQRIIRDTGDDGSVRHKEHGARLRGLPLASVGRAVQELAELVQCGAGVSSQFSKTSPS